MNSPLPELSIIVPVLNDSVELRGLLDCLEEQTKVNFEVIVCDGGSSDGVVELVTAWSSRSGFALRHIQSDAGRGRQMNAGAACAYGRFLLFLHADSRFTTPAALFLALQAYTHNLSASPGIMAGHFRLLFTSQDQQRSLAYFYLEAKARLNRGDCIRGDQGYLIERHHFELLGGFDTTLPYLEDVRMARRIAANGQWLLLPADIVTSNRRFAQEGYIERQVANVIIVNAMETGWSELLTAMPALYRASTSSGRLQLHPLLCSIHDMICAHDRSWQETFWRNTGRHVAGNAWQLFFWLDVHRTFRESGGIDQVKPRWLKHYLRRLKPLFHTAAAGRIARHLTKLWLRWMMYKTGRG